MNIRIDNAAVAELRDGFSYDAGIYSCLSCGEGFEDGIIYDAGGRLADARKAVKNHINEKHGSVFEMLLSEDKRRTGLTDTQKEFLLCFYGGKSDSETAKATGASPSTVRYQRFSFREKAKQAKVILALSGLLEERLKNCGDDPEIHESATMIDERYMTTDTEADKVIKTFFLSIEPPVLKSIPAREKSKLVVLKLIAGQFELSKRYAEKQVNEILKPIIDDYVSIRRYLIEYGFMDRTGDCGEYWLK